MHKITYKILTFCFIFIAFYSCNNDDDGSIITQSSSENDFVWRAMNLWYFWQADVPNLADSQLNNNYNQFLNSYASPDLLFNDLLNEPADRFSAIFSDSNALLNLFQGTSTSFGYEFSLYAYGENNTDVVGFVEYVVENGPAANAGIERGDYFTSVNGTNITVNNFNTLLGSSSYTLGFADFMEGATNQENDDFFVLNGEEATIAAVELTENPVFLTSVIEEDGVTIGYLVYNGFTSSFDTELNNAIGSLAGQGITELVLDLRYNGGGSVRSAQYLGSMITGSFTGQVFATLEFNEKASSQNQTYNFVTQMTNGINLNLLGLDHLYVLTTGSSASASEMVINSLRPYIEVTTIGSTTSGKNVGQIPLFDSPQSAYTDPDTATSTHSWALLPITFSYFNSQGSNDFANGITQDYLVRERAYFGNILPLGDPQEPLLRTAIDLILGNPLTTLTPAASFVQGNSIFNENMNGENSTKIFSSKENKILGNSMYLEEPVYLNP